MPVGVVTTMDVNHEDGSELRLLTTRAMTRTMPDEESLAATCTSCVRSLAATWSVVDAGDQRSRSISELNGNCGAPAMIGFPQ